MKNDQIMLDINSKATFAVSLISTIIITPFSFNNFLQGRYILGLITLGIVAMCVINTWLCYKNKYHLLFNLFVITPIVIIGIACSIYFLNVTASYWAFLGILAIYFILPISYAWRANIVFSIIVMYVSWISIEFEILIRFYAVFIGTSVYAYASMNQIYRLYAKVKGEAVHDSLTGLYNRNLLDDTLEGLISINRRTGIPMTLIMLDLDFFKKINDKFGHEKGDDVLKEVAEILRNNIRASDKVFRIGGEEFLVPVYNIDENKGIMIAEKIRNLIMDEVKLPEGIVSASFGVAELKPSMTAREWLRECDAQVYKAKSTGRNKVCSSQDGF